MRFILYKLLSFVFCFQLRHQEQRWSVFHEKIKHQRSWLLKKQVLFQSACAWHRHLYLAFSTFSLYWIDNELVHVMSLVWLVSFAIWLVKILILPRWWTLKSKVDWKVLSGTYINFYIHSGLCMVKIIDFSLTLLPTANYRYVYKNDPHPLYIKLQEFRMTPLQMCEEFRKASTWRKWRKLWRPTMGILCVVCTSKSVAAQVSCM